MGFSRQKYWSSCHALLQGIFSTCRLNSHLLYLLHWQAGSLPLATLWKPHRKYTCSKRFLKVYLNFYLFIFGCTGFSFCAWAFSSCAQASHCADFSCRGGQALGCVVFGLWPRDLAALRHVESSGPGIEPVSPALAGGFLSTGATGKSLKDGSFSSCYLGTDELIMIIQFAYFFHFFFLNSWSYSFAS